MHKFVLFFMLALTASLVTVLSEPIFAQEMTSGDKSMQATTEGSATGGETVDNSSVGMEGTTMKSHTDSPLKQMSMGVDPHQIQCGDGHKLVFKASNWHPACVKESSFQTLSAWGWISNHDPSHDDLTKMMEDNMAKYPKETEQKKETQMKENMDVNDKSSNTNSTSADQPKPQSHSINLSESMEMGAQ
jgi:hypothetical protein